MHTNPTFDLVTRPARGPLGPLDPARMAGATLLAVWAHPDDESYLGGGFMAAIAERGGRVVNISATLGEHGTDDPTACPPSSLATIRRGELATALDALGVESSVTLGYEDGTCDQVSDEMGARRIGVALDQIEPDLVLTFGPDGVTGHPDHRAIARWTAMAVAERADIALVTTTAGAVWPADIVEAMHEVNAFYPGYPERVVADPTWAVTVEGGLLEKKLAALHAHVSQIGPVHQELGPADYRRLASVEGYRAANEIALRMFTGDTARIGSAA